MKNTSDKDSKQFNDLLLFSGRIIFFSAWAWASWIYPDWSQEIHLLVPAAGWVLLVFFRRKSTTPPPITLLVAHLCKTILSSSSLTQALKALINTFERSAWNREDGDPVKLGARTIRAASFISISLGQREGPADARKGEFD